MNQEELIDLVLHGGGTLIFIALCSVVAIALAIERLIAMWRIVPDARSLHEAISRELLRGDVAQARLLASRSQALAAEIYLAGFARHQQRKGKAFEATVERERASLVLLLKRRLWALGTIGTISPFVGLFGTVVGIMSAFSAMAASGAGGFAVVASGISQALVATASGIFVAIEAVVFYNFFQAKIGRVAAELRLLTEEFCELLAEVPPEAAAVGAAVVVEVGAGSEPIPERQDTKEA
ncbi:MAG: MotA/TolQ/ExbB proton channel family protein [Myxococcales bacterium]|jgi:biopolymer transport protein ExbB|nr:MotA/TolQ/ExbB proton channel family protein [Myxococcales bacterium]